MRIGVPKEQLIHETRVAATPKTVQQILKLGFTIAIEHNAGKLANFEDEAFKQAGADIVSTTEVWQSSIILKVNAPEENEITLLNPGSILVSFIWPAQNPKLMEKLADRGITVIAMDAVPRIARAQSLDALSSMAHITGYRAVIEAAHEFGRVFSGNITAAGKVSPAKVMVVGAGVTGLAAISVANRLGAIVCAFDTRSEVKEQVQSMGALFLTLDPYKENKDKNNHEMSTSDALIKAEIKLLSAQIKETDIVITTVLLPGEPAPKLITHDMVDSMKSGSIIVDLAAQNGGNCEDTVINQLITTKNGIKIIGYTDLTRRLPAQSSQLYGTNLVNLLKLLCKKKDGNITFDFHDAVVCSLTVIRSGKIIWPTPSVQVVDQPIISTQIATKKKKKEKTVSSPWHKYTIIALAITLYCCVIYIAPKEFLNHLTVFSLSCIIGYYVIWNVSHTLHTPLMSITNAISGIITIGALLQIERGKWIVSCLSFIAVLIGSINIFGGFTLTQRMLKILRKR